MIVGFTGTSQGMTAHQKSRVSDLLRSQSWIEAHHGDCVGADAEFDALIRSLGRGHPLVVIHPPILEHKRAKCAMVGDVVLAPQDYLVRNRSIVDACTTLIAAPKMRFEELRSGTWSTIRYARKTKTRRIIVLPNGELEHV